MKDKKSEAEYANKKINQILNGEDDNDAFDVGPLVTSNKISLVLKNNETENKG